jgi:DNA ligase-1
MEPRREFLMQAHPYNPDKHDVSGWYMSEKLDGIRCFWDGGLSRDIPTTSVPWANCHDPKTGQPKKRLKQMATGLWSRYGNPIVAPDWFLNTLPAGPLDGELFAGRGQFQFVTGAARKNKADDEQWKQIQFAVFGYPNFWAVMQTGQIKNTNFVKTLDEKEIERWVKNRDKELLRDYTFLDGNPYFPAEITNLAEIIDTASDTHFMVRQTKLPESRSEAAAVVAQYKQKIILEGGEGLMLRDPDQCWTPKRVHGCLKVKGALDAEGTVVGFTSGRKTDKGSKLLGLIGALILDFNGKRLELAGLNNEEREFSSPVYTQFAKDFPGKDMPEDMDGKHFKIGDRVTFTYRELSNDGIPKDARYLRRRKDA